MVCFGKLSILNSIPSTVTPWLHLVFQALRPLPVVLLGWPTNWFFRSRILQWIHGKCWNGCEHITSFSANYRTKNEKKLTCVPIQGIYYSAILTMGIQNSRFCPEKPEASLLALFASHHCRLRSVSMMRTVKLDVWENEINKKNAIVIWVAIHQIPGASYFSDIVECKPGHETPFEDSREKPEI